MTTNQEPKTYTAEDVTKMYQMGYEHGTYKKEPLTNDMVLKYTEVLLKKEIIHAE